MVPSTLNVSGDLFADFDLLQRQLDELFGRRTWPSNIRSGGRSAFPAINMGTSSEAVEIYAFAPGIDPKKIEVSLDKGVLTIAGERGSDLPAESSKVNVYSRERFAGAFKRVVSLPNDVDPARVDAAYAHGVLRISVPKREASKPRRVEVQSAG